jgi:hypothetical protein
VWDHITDIIIIISSSSSTTLNCAKLKFKQLHKTLFLYIYVNSLIMTQEGPRYVALF